MNTTKFLLILSSVVMTVHCSPIAPVQNSTNSSVKKKSSLISANNPNILPENEKPAFPDLSDMIEVKEEDIPDGTLVLEVDEPLQNHEAGESMDTANNVVFRPLFRYREKQDLRRNANNRIRRRYYVPRRSYRQTAYYRPYRSASSYYYPYRYYRRY